MSISCIIPVFNQAQFISAALDSVFAQTVPIDEVIVVDDASEDNLMEVLDAYPHPIKLIQLPQNSGPAAARNAGIRASSGEWLTFLDADDVWHEEKTERQLAAFAADPELDYCLTYKKNFWESSMAEEEARLREEGHPIVNEIPAYTFQAMMLRRSTFERVGYLNETLRVAEDTDWYARAQEMELKRSVLEVTLVRRRFHTTNISYETTTDVGLVYREQLIMERIKRQKAKKREQQKLAEEGNK